MIFDFRAALAGFKCNANNRRSRFHFEAAWVNETDFKSIFEKNWKPGSCMGSEQRLIYNINNCAKSMEMWNIRKERKMNREPEEKKSHLNILVEFITIKD